MEGHMVLSPSLTSHTEQLPVLDCCGYGFQFTREAGGFQVFSLRLELSEEGLTRVSEIILAAHHYLALVVAMSEADRRDTWEELAEVRWGRMGTHCYTQLLAVLVHAPHMLTLHCTTSCNGSTQCMSHTDQADFKRSDLHNVWFCSCQHTQALCCYLPYFVV
jgi:secreted Zn-dependent insulinase-like peptidase